MMFKGHIGARTGRNVLEGKNIHCDSAGFDNFNDYFTDSAASTPEQTPVNTVRQNEIKSFINTEKSVRGEEESPLSQLPSRKRLSFKADADSDSSSIASYQSRSRLISKRGMQSFPGEDEEYDEKSLERFSPQIKTYSRGSISHSGSEKKYVRRISNRGMQSFPEDEDKVMTVFELEDDDDCEIFSPEPTMMEKVIRDGPKQLSLVGDKENEENLNQIKNNENIEKSSEKSSSHISENSMEVNSKPEKKTAKSKPSNNWYIFDDDSLIDPAKVIITAYGVQPDTGVSVNNQFPKFVTDLHLVDEDDSLLPSQNDWKSKIPDLDIFESDDLTKGSRKSYTREKQTPPGKTKSPKGKQTKTLPQKQSTKKLKEKNLKSPKKKPSKNLSDAKKAPLVKKVPEIIISETDSSTSVDEESLSESDDRFDTEESSENVALSNVASQRKFSSPKKTSVPKRKVSPRKQRKSPRTKSPSPAKKSPGLKSRKSTPTKEKVKDRKSSSKSKQSLTGSKKKQSPVQKNEKASTSVVRRILSSPVKGKSPSPQKNKSNIPGSRKRAAGMTPEMESPAKRSKVEDELTRRKSRRLSGVSPSKESRKEPKTVIRKEPKTDIRKEPKTDIRKEPKTGIRKVPKPDSRKVPQPDSREEPKPDSRKVPKPDSRKVPKPDSRKEPKPDSREEPKPDSRKVSKPDSRVEPKTYIRKERTPGSQEEPISAAARTGKTPASKRKSDQIEPIPVPTNSKKEVNAGSSRRSSRISSPIVSPLIEFSGSPRRSSARLLKSPARSHISDITGVSFESSNSDSQEENPPRECQGCQKPIPENVEACRFCGSPRRKGSPGADNRMSPQLRSNSKGAGNRISPRQHSRGEVPNWKCRFCRSHNPDYLAACVYCNSSRRKGLPDDENRRSPHLRSYSRGKNKNLSPQKSKEKAQRTQKAPSKPVGQTVKTKSPVQQKPSTKSIEKHGSFALKKDYTFRTDEGLKMDHKISYCICSQTDTAIMAMMKLQKGGQRRQSTSSTEIFSTVLEGKIEVLIGRERRELGVHDTFAVAKGGRYSITNLSAKTSCLSFTTIK